MKLQLALFCLALAPKSLFAGTLYGYVVKVDSTSAYFDLGQSSGVALEQHFTIFSEGEELKHPVTGKPIGRIETELAKGWIEQVTAAYSIGRVTSMKGTLAAGNRVRLEVAPAAPPPAAQVVTVSPSGAVGRAAAWRSNPLDIEAADIATGDLLGDGRTHIVLIDTNRVLAYSAENPDKPICSYSDPGTGIRNLAVDVADLDKNGKAEVFVTHYNPLFERVETNVFTCENGEFKKTTTVPWMTRAFQDDSGQWRLAGQQLVANDSFPFGGIYRVEFKDGKYAFGDQIRLKRVDWLYGFTQGSDHGDTFPIFLTASNRIRLQFKKGPWVSADSYGETANRVRWLERSLMFYPRMVLLRQGNDMSGLFATHNVAALGGFAGAFGAYNSGEIHRLRWTGLSFEPDWKTDLGGYTAGVAPVEGGVLVPVVSKSGRTTVMKFQ